jgi:hypothetical protein
MLGGQRTVFLQNGAWQFDARARHVSVINHHALHATSSSTAEYRARHNVLGPESVSLHAFLYEKRKANTCLLPWSCSTLVSLATYNRKYMIQMHDSRAPVCK